MVYASELDGVDVAWALRGRRELITEWRFVNQLGNGMASNINLFPNLISSFLSWTASTARLSPATCPLACDAACVLLLRSIQPGGSSSIFVAPGW